MKRLISPALACTFAIAASSTLAPAGTSDTTVTYQGNLADEGQAANGTFDLDFALFDALSGGNQIGPDVTFDDHPVLDGLFTVELDFGASAFDNSSRWLEISVNGNALSPRQSIARSPYSIQTRGVFVDADHNVGIGTSDPNYPLHVESDGVYSIVGRSSGASARGVIGEATSSSGTNFGGYFLNSSTSGRGVYGNALANSGTNYGGYFGSNSTSGRAVFGYVGATSGTTFGGHFGSNSPNGRGVYGEALATTGSNYGGYFKSQSSSGLGVYGVAGASGGFTYGGYFENNSTSGGGIYGLAAASSGHTTAGYFWNNSTSGRAVYGEAAASTGLTYGVIGHSHSASGFDFWAAGAGTNYGAPSSRRWKSDIVPIDDSLYKLAQLRGVYFDWDEAHGGAHDVGMIAEEVGAVMPEIVNYEENGIDAIGMDYSKMTPLLVEAVNALRDEKDAQIASLEDEVARMSERNDTLETRLAQLEALMATVAIRQGAER